MFPCKQAVASGSLIHGEPEGDRKRSSSMSPTGYESLTMTTCVYSIHCPFGVHTHRIISSQRMSKPAMVPHYSMPRLLPLDSRSLTPCTPHPMPAMFKTPYPRSYVRCSSPQPLRNLLLPFPLTRSAIQAPAILTPRTPLSALSALSAQSTHIAPPLRDIGKVDPPTRHPKLPDHLVCRSGASQPVPFSQVSIRPFFLLNQPTPLKT